MVAGPGSDALFKDRSPAVLVLRASDPVDVDWNPRDPDRLSTAKF